MLPQPMTINRLDIEAKQCLLCGSAQSTSFKFRSNLSPEYELCRLYHEVVDQGILVEDIIPLQRIHILRRANALLPIAKLPYEVLDEVFRLACRLSCFAHHHYQVVLSSVSSRWRAIIHSSPLLWTHLSLDFCYKDAKSLDRRIGLLRLYLLHSGSLSLHLKMSFHRSVFTQRWFDVNNLIHSTVDNVIIANLHRIKILDLENASSKWLAYTPQLSGIQSFRYKGGFDPYIGAPVISFAKSSRLSDLTLIDWPLIDIGTSDFTSLITITLEAIEITVCVGLLAACPKLVEYRCRSPKPPRFSSWHPLKPWNATVTLESLEIFEWDISLDENLGLVEGSMFRYLCLPALRSLRLHTFLHSKHVAVRLFCKRMPISLETLHLSMICGAQEPEGACLIDSFPLGCQLKELTLYANGCLCFFHHTFRSLSDAKRFPKLERMIIDDKNKGRDVRGWEIELNDIFASLVHKALALRAPLLPGFFLKFLWFRVRWPKEIRDELWLLTMSGEFRLTIQEEQTPFGNGLPRFYDSDRMLML
ncbi:hypothetical protein AN958_11567 [Leucoagaricus sp. SymC.cos]|nr:hypothetical protein AN958_11567 [Leucoagaricus sp. SymC.cos]